MAVIIYWQAKEISRIMKEHNPEADMEELTAWAPIAGRWELKESLIVYLGPEDSIPPIPYGIALSKSRMRSGSIETRVHFKEAPKDSAGRIIFGYNTETREYFSAGIGGYNSAYVLDEFLPARGWKAVSVLGNIQNFVTDSEFHIETRIFGQKVVLLVDDIKVVEHNLSRPPAGDQVGIFAWGTSPIEFKATKLAATKPKAFVVMQFGEPYDSLYRDVIKPIAKEKGLNVYRVDDVYKPGIILQDIIRGIVEAEVVIAEITPPNPNVFYEIGYSHALHKTTILLAEKGKELPFDIRSYRCIFYDNTIGGKKDVENYLRRHLTSILGEFEQENLLE